MRAVRALLACAATTALAVAAAPHSASACTCATPAPDVVPRPLDAAPLNTKVRVAIYRLGMGPEAKPAHVYLLDAAGARVDSDERFFGAGATLIVELTPRRPLAKAARYEVVLALPGSPAQSVGFVSTSALTDRAPPLPPRTLDGKVYALPYVPGRCWPPARPFAVLHVDESIDDVTPPGALLYAVWTSAGGAPIDYRTEPLSYVRAEAGSLVLGADNLCTPSRLELPAVDTLRVGLRVVDLAGNMAAPREVVLDLSHPSRAFP
ncbi:MAG TPA: hypothetical protein VG389_17860 [Myxococcota bacterium]|jgi:hypothetical protein|nr:hypothetical protein [Myxococcota bacterium]